MSKLEEFDKTTAVQLTADRGAVYGHPSVHFGRVARLKAVVAECKDPKVRHALDVICDKIARLIETPDHLDSCCDLAGYARTIMMLADGEPK